MLSTIIKVTAKTATFSLLLYILNFFFLQVFGYSQALFLYYYPLMYFVSVLGTIAAILLIVLHFIERKNKDIVGMVFLIGTSLQMIVVYCLFQNSITSDNLNQIERINVFVLFILFLLFETLIIIQLLNKKQ